MKIALGTHTLMGYPPTIPNATTREMRQNLFAWMRQHGFDGVDLGQWWFDFYTEPIETIMQLRDDLVNAGLELTALNCLRKNVTHPAVAEQNRADLRRTIEVARAVRPKYVSISLSLPTTVVGIPQERALGYPRSPGSSQEANEDEFIAAAQFLAELARDAAEAGIEITVELHHCSLADTSRSLLRLLELVGQPNVSPNPDLGNVLWAYDIPKEQWYESVAALAGRVKFWHVKNFQRIHLYEGSRAVFLHAPLGEGDIDYRWALAQFTAAGFDGDISIESAGLGDALGFALRSKAYLDGLIADLKSGIGLAVH